MSNAVRDLLKFDPLATAEDITGTSTHDMDSPAMAVGFLLMQGWAKEKDRVLKERGDTVFSNQLSDYVAIIEAYGFEKVLELPFTPDPGRNEMFYVYATRDGLLLSFDTYDGVRVNGGKVRYNWKPHDRKTAHQFTSSGGYRQDGEEWVWTGDHDCREALLFNMDSLKANGTLVSPWVERPFMWLLHYGDARTKDYDYDTINAERIAMLPDWVREMITP